MKSHLKLTDLVITRILFICNGFFKPLNIDILYVSVSYFYEIIVEHVLNTLTCTVKIILIHKKCIIF